MEKQKKFLTGLIVFGIAFLTMPSAHAFSFGRSYLNFSRIQKQVARQQVDHVPVGTEIVNQEGSRYTLSNGRQIQLRGNQQLVVLGTRLFTVDGSLQPLRSNMIESDMVGMGTPTTMPTGMGGPTSMGGPTTIVNGQ